MPPRASGRSNGKDGDETHRKYRASHLAWIRLGDMSISPSTQRRFRQARADHLAADFDLEGMGFLTVNLRDGCVFVVDGQHRRAALMQIGFSEDDVLQCEVYDGLTEQQEAELFLDRNDRLVVNSLDKFNVAVVAGREAENEIAACVRNQGLYIGRVDRGGITAVSTLIAVHRRIGALGLGKVLRIIRDAYGEGGFEAAVVDGLGWVEQRYERRLDEAHMIEALAAASGGLTGLITQSNKTRATLGQPRAQCIAATAVGFYNRGRLSPPVTRLAPWWKEG